MSDVFDQLMKLYLHLLVESEHNSSSTRLEQMNQQLANNQSICKLIIRQDTCQNSSSINPSCDSSMITSNNNLCPSSFIETCPFNLPEQHPHATCHDNPFGNMSNLHEQNSNDSQHLPISENIETTLNTSPQPEHLLNDSSLSLKFIKESGKSTKHVGNLKFVHINANSLAESYSNPIKRKRGRPKKERK